MKIVPFFIADNNSTGEQAEPKSITVVHKKNAVSL